MTSRNATQLCKTCEQMFTYSGPIDNFDHVKQCFACLGKAHDKILNELRKVRTGFLANSEHSYAERMQLLIRILDPDAGPPPMLRVGAKGSWSWYRDLPGPIHLAKGNTILCKDVPTRELADAEGYWMAKWTDCVDLFTCRDCRDALMKSARKTSKS